MIKSKEVFNLISQVAFSTVSTLENSYEIAMRAFKHDIPGAMVECGVAAGAQIGAMMLAGKDYNDLSRQYYLFDSFCGIPLAGPKDDEQPGVGAISHDVNVPDRDLLKSSGITSVGEQVVKSNMGKWGLDGSRATFVKGWFQDTVPEYPIGDIAVLRLDGDLYASTKICLEHLYPKVVKGGYIIIDDYALAGCRRAVHEYFGDDLEYHVVPGTQTVVWWIK